MIAADARRGLLFGSGAAVEDSAYLRVVVLRTRFRTKPCAAGPVWADALLRPQSRPYVSYGRSLRPRIALAQAATPTKRHSETSSKAGRLGQPPTPCRCGRRVA